MNPTEPSAIVAGLVSTIIPVRNRPVMLQTAVNSVLGQSYAAIEIVIVDDGSTDGTRRVAEGLAAGDPERIKLVVLPPRPGEASRGPGPAREAGRCIARGEFLQYLDSDDRLLPNKFADQVRTLDRHPDGDIAYGETRLIEPSGRVLVASFKWTGQRRESLFPGLLVDRWWCTHTPLYRRQLTDALGSWSDLRWSQDWEYDARAGGLGAKLVHCGSLVSEHVEHDGARQTSGADWERDPDRLRNRMALLSALWLQAERAGVDVAAPERQHFARWAFGIGRRCSAAGLVDEAEQCFRLAMQAGASGRGTRGVAGFQRTTRLLGHRAAGRLASLAERFRRGTGRETLPQSFSGQRPTEAKPS